MPFVPLEQHLQSLEGGLRSLEQLPPQTYREPDVVPEPRVYIEQYDDEPSVKTPLLTKIREFAVEHPFGSAAIVAATSGAVFGLLAPVNSEPSAQQKAQKPTATAPSASAPSKNAVPNPVTTPSISVPLTTAATIPAAWQACDTPRVKILVKAEQALKVPIALTDGSEAILHLQSGEMPKVKYSGSMAVGACLKDGVGAEQLAVKEGTVTIARNLFMTSSIFPDMIAKKPAATETVEGFDASGALKADAKSKLSAEEAARINAMIKIGGKDNELYRKTADYLLKSGMLARLTVENGTSITAILDAVLASTFKKANKNITYVFTGQYDGLQVAYQQAAQDESLLDAKSVQASGFTSFGATIANVGAKK